MEFDVVGQALPPGFKREAVAASQTAQIMGVSGAIGDYMFTILVVPESTSPGNIILLDGAVSHTLFVGGADSVTTLIPFHIPVGWYSETGAWKITTGASVHCWGVGKFS